MASPHSTDSTATPAPAGRTPEGTARNSRCPHGRRRATVPNHRSWSALHWPARSRHPGCNEAPSRRTAHQPRACDQSSLANICQAGRAIANRGRMRRPDLRLSACKLFRFEVRGGSKAPRRWPQTLRSLALTTLEGVAIVSNMRAVLPLDERCAFDLNRFVELTVLQVPRPVRASSHLFKYRLAFVVEGICVLRYDNEAGKGDHRHVGAVESLYTFSTPEKLYADFMVDVTNWRG